MSSVQFLFACVTKSYWSYGDTRRGAELGDGSKCVFIFHLFIYCVLEEGLI